MNSNETASGSPRSLVHTDGACIGNPGPGGWAVLVQDVDPATGELSTLREMVGGESDTTNNRMELTAAIEALRSIPARQPVEIISDSQYVVTGSTEWLPRWKRKGWKNSAKKPVKNKGLWLELEALADGRDIVWTWVRGHDGNEMNERADVLAEAEAQRRVI
ncbi:ribonuclease HI [Jiella sonneratiae]|uniref:Ribonuclease H n=1 Tax=Jiella sonneratiae TaxID=2816856 RepID=A0ABS3J4Q6_9HYPH|nr:ribonuclease HI [Jiella sonneratiae]MBO0904670.1 ribonuclease HI [Jiella sonneratiae]